MKSFAEVRLGFTEEMTLQEAKRCISCGTGCIQACADNVCLAHSIYFGGPAEIEQKVLEKRKMRGGFNTPFLLIPQGIGAFRSFPGS